MSPWLLCSVATLLSVERIAYVLIWREPSTFKRWSTRPALKAFGGPVEVLMLLFVAFKVLQLAVFVGWHLAVGDGTLWPYSRDPVVVATGAALISAGQVLNLSVFKRLGKVGVFYGNRLGYTVSWCRRFPFTWFEHPQYVGTVIAIWGFFVAIRFPAPDWMLIPLLETVYYAAGARLEQDPIAPTTLKRRWKRRGVNRRASSSGLETLGIDTHGASADEP
jgi:methylene-fatty-acyl-phospholipid synthase